MALLHNFFTPKIGYNRKKVAEKGSDDFEIVYVSSGCDSRSFYL